MLEGISIEHIETGSFPQTNREASPQQFRIISWNIARGTRLSAITDFLSSSNPDLILLQEVDINCRRTGYRNVAQDLSQTLRMNYVFGIEFQELSQGSHSAPAYHGQATFSRWQLFDSRLLRFRHQSNFWDPQWYTPNLSFMERRVGGRMALVSQVCVADSTLAVYNLHLESRKGNDLRNRQLAEVLEDARHYDRGVLVVAGGDFNVDVRLQRENWAIRDAGFDNPFAKEKAPTTAPSLLGRQKSLDSILTRGKITILEAEIHRGVNASDHYPLSLTVRLDDVVEKKS